MIIDVHCHVWNKKIVANEVEKLLFEIAEFALHEGFDPATIHDAEGDRLIKDMDEAGIDKTVVFSLDFDLTFKGGVNYREYNDYVANFVKQYPDRLIGFAGIDLRRGREAIDELERCVQDHGFKGVKLWPLTGFYPDDPKFYPFYERAEDLGVTILCHTGIGPAYMKYCRPVYIDTVAYDFRKINFIMAHGGDPWSNEALAVAGKNPNVYFDISASQLIFKKFPMGLYQTLAMTKIIIGLENVLFGTDWPSTLPIMSPKEWVEAIQTLELPMPLQMMGLPEFTEEDKKKILGENAKKVLGL
ncbi:MAG: amidohydrolase family protein [Candidatus Lokiarchaeia archaeon]